ncbi:MAG: murein biosynthesis integral membrane protein MurJ, partial [Chloroflexi bacterium]|nr:murein biosynthesis integral membrane protein MurJ [Chloroflexota bacterium]
MDDPDVLTGVVADEEPGLHPVAAGAATRLGASSARALARAGIIVTTLFLASRVLGYVRTIAFAAAVPEVAQLGPFYAAFRIPDFLFQLVAAGALSSALIPVIAGLFAKQEEARAWRVVSTVTTLMLSILLVLAALVLWFAPEFVAVITPGFDDAQLAETTELTRIMVLSPLLLAAGAIATSVLNSRERFGAAALAPLVYNAAMIFGALVFVPAFGIEGLAYGVVLGALGHILVQLPSLARLGAKIRPHVDLRDDQARTALLLMVPRAIGLGATQVVFLVMTSLASTLGPEAIPVFNFAFAMLQIPIGVIGVPLGIVLLPSLSREAALGAGDGFTRLVTRGLSLLGYVMVPIAALGIVVSEDVVRLLFGVADIGESATEATAAALAIFLLGLTAHALITVLARAFYALKDTRTPVAAALVAVISNILVANVLIEPLGLNGLAAAIAISAWLETLVLVILLLRRVPAIGPGMGHVWMVMAKTLVVSLAGALVAYGIETALVGAWGED